MQVHREYIAPEILTGEPKRAYSSSERWRSLIRRHRNTFHMVKVQMSLKVQMRTRAVAAAGG